jgi:hypothetical protein
MVITVLALEQVVAVLARRRLMYRVDQVVLLVV